MLPGRNSLQYRQRCGVALYPHPRIFPTAASNFKDVPPSLIENFFICRITGAYGRIKLSGRMELRDGSHFSEKSL